MLKVSFSIENIQNTLQRHYRRGQTVLSLEQNVLEDKDKIKIKLFVKIIKMIIKDNTGQTLLPFDQKFCLDQKSKLLPCFLTKILLKEKRAEPHQIKKQNKKMIKNRIAPDSNLSLLYVLLIKIDQCFLNGRYKSNHIVGDSNFLRTFETEKKHESLMKT